MRRLAIHVGALLISAALAFGAPPADAQNPARLPLIGVLGASDESAVLYRGLRSGLEELGYVEGRTIRTEFRWAHGRFDRLPELAAELVSLNVDVLVPLATQASLAARAATRTIPIVFVAVADPLASGLVDALSKPGLNATGTSAMAVEIVGKQLELLNELGLGTRDIAVLWNPDNPVFQSLQMQQAEAAARSFGLQLRPVEASRPDQFAAALEGVRQEGVRALLVLNDPIFILHRDSLASLALRHGLLMVSGSREYAEAGGLIAYGPSFFRMAGRAASYIDRVLKGAKPGDLPVEQPTSFELSVNLVTARAIGLDIPPALLARADEVIE